NRLLRRVRDFAEVRHQGAIDLEIARGALEMLEVDEYGLDEIDRKLLTTIIERFGGGPVGLNALGSSIAEDRGTIEDLYEPYLIQIGFLQRTPRGRVASRLAYEHLGYAFGAARKQADLFSSWVGRDSPGFSQLRQVAQEVRARFAVILGRFADAARRLDEQDVRERPPVVTLQV